MVDGGFALVGQGPLLGDGPWKHLVHLMLVLQQRLPLRFQIPTITSKIQEFCVAHKGDLRASGSKLWGKQEKVGQNSLRVFYGGGVLLKQRSMIEEFSSSITAPGRMTSFSIAAKASFKARLLRLNESVDLLTRPPVLSCSLLTSC